MKQIACLFVFCTLAAAVSAQQPPAGAPAATQPQPRPTPPTAAPAPPRTTAQSPPRTASAVMTLAVRVTDRSGNPLEDVAVAVSGPVERAGSTSEDGGIAFKSLRTGTYRLRFERDGFITLEREVVMRAQPTDVSVALSAAPAKPAPAAPPPVAAPAPPPPSSTRVVEPRTLSLTDFLDRNLIGGEPQKTTLLGCVDGGTSRLLQVREPFNDQQHADADEVLYVVAGAGIISVRGRDIKAGPGHFMLIPRGVPHSIRRDGRNPVILLSVLSGSPCHDDAAPNR